MPTLSEQKRRRREQLSREQASMQRWWEKAPTMPGEACTAAQRRLAEKVGIENGGQVGIETGAEAKDHDIRP